MPKTQPTNQPTIKNSFCIKGQRSFDPVVSLTFFWIRWTPGYMCIIILGTHSPSMHCQKRQAEGGSVIENIIHVNDTFLPTTFTSIQMNTNYIPPKQRSSSKMIYFSKTMCLATLHKLYWNGVRNIKILLCYPAHQIP